MVIVAESGPQLIYGFTQTSTGQVTEYNEERGPSLNDLGQGMLDPRPPYAYYPGSAVGTKVRGFWNGYAAIDQIPGTISTNCIAQSQQSSVGNVTLTASNSGIVATPGVTLTPPEGGATVTGLVGIDMGPTANQTAGLPAITYGSGGTIAIWDPRAAIARAVTVSVTFLTTNSSFDSGVLYTVLGRDLYGYKMEELITGNNTGSSQTKTYTTRKAFKYISAVNIAASSGTYIGSTAVMVGVADIYGFPIRVDHPAYATMWWGTSSNASLVTLSTGLHTFGSTATATSTTPDVRGTFASSTASSTANTVKLVAFVTPSVQNLPTSTTGSGFSDNSGLFGVNQFSSV